MELDVSRFEYDLVLAGSDLKTQLHFSELIDDLKWSEAQGEAAVRIEATVRDDIKYQGKTIREWLALGSIIGVLAKETGSSVVAERTRTGSLRVGEEARMPESVLSGGANTRFFYGVGWFEAASGPIWDWKPSPAKGRVLHLLAYDPAIYLVRSRDDRYYKEGSEARSIITSLARDFGFDVDLPPAFSATIEDRLVFHRESPWDIIQQVTKLVQDLTGEEWVLRVLSSSTGPVIQVLGPETNYPMFVLSEFVDPASVDRFTLDEYVSQVKVMGAPNSFSATSIKTLLTAKQILGEDVAARYGHVQDVVHKDSRWGAGDPTEDAKKLLESKARPRRLPRIIHPDIPRIRKGDRVKVQTEGIEGTFRVLGVEHNAMDRQMVLSLEESKR